MGSQHVNFFNLATYFGGFMTNVFSLNPLLRSTVGFDRFNDLFASLTAGDDLNNG